MSVGQEGNAKLMYERMKEMRERMEDQVEKAKILHEGDPTDGGILEFYERTKSDLFVLSSLIVTVATLAEENEALRKATSLGHQDRSLN